MTINIQTYVKLKDAERRSLAKCTKLRARLASSYWLPLLASKLREELRQELCCLVTIQRELSKYEP